MKQYLMGIITGVSVAIAGIALAQTFQIIPNLRVTSALDVTGALTFNSAAGSAGQVATSNGAGVDPSWQTAATTSPGGANTQVQYNNVGAFGGDAGLTYSAASDDLTVGDQMEAARINLTNEFNLNGSAGTAGQVLTSAGDGILPTWSAGGGSVSFPLLAPDGAVGAPSYSFTDVPEWGLWRDPSTGNLGTMILQHVDPSLGPTVTTSLRIRLGSFDLVGSDMTIPTQLFWTGGAGTVNGTTNMEDTVMSTIDVQTLDMTGEVLLNGDPGAAGECFKSQGAGMSPIWTAC